MNLQPHLAWIGVAQDRETPPTFRESLTVVAVDDAALDPAGVAATDTVPQRVSRFGLERYLVACNPSCSG